MTEDERQNYEQQITAALAADMSASGTAAAPPIAAADLRRLFCDNWDMVKTVITALGVIFPPALLVVTPLIKVGDIAKGIICR